MVKCWLGGMYYTETGKKGHFLHKTVPLLNGKQRSGTSKVRIHISFLNDVWSLCFSFPSVPFAIHAARCFFVRCDRSTQRVHCQMMDYFGWAVLQLWIQCFLVHCEYSWCNIRNDPINAIQQLFSCYSAAPLNVPVMCLDGFQIKGLQKGNKYSCKQLEYINP